MLLSSGGKAKGAACAVHPTRGGCAEHREPSGRAVLSNRASARESGCAGSKEQVTKDFHFCKGGLHATCNIIHVDARVQGSGKATVSPVPEWNLSLKDASFFIFRGAV